MAAFIREKGISMSTTDVAPCHFLFKIESVSMLTGNDDIEKYTSAHFEAGGYKWKLIFYPRGNKRKNVTGYISIYLTVADTSGFLPGWEVHAIFRLFLLDQNNGSYLVLRDTYEKGKRFRATKMEWGYDKVISLSTFNDVSYGYVVDDECVFGAEVYVLKEIRFPKGEFRFLKGECFSILKEPITSKYSWKIGHFFTKKCHYSDIFQQWKMQIYPNGNGSGEGSHLSLYLVWANPQDITLPYKIYAKVVLRILDRQGHKDFNVKESFWFSPTRTIYELPMFISIENFKAQATGFLSMEDSCTIEAEVKVNGQATTQII